MFSEAFLDRLASAKRVAVLTGAGASAESGIPTFRDPDGLWKQFKPGDLASMEGFRKNPLRVQAWYAARRANVLAAEPHAGHFALAELEKIVPEFTLITQNVDGLHERAGSKNIIRIHGSLLDFVCATCGENCASLGVSPEQEKPASCSCGGLVRPTVVWFGEMLDASLLEQASRAASECDVFLSIGTAAEVYPAAALPLIAADNAAFVLEINPRKTAISSGVSEVIRGTAGNVLPEILYSLDAVRVP